MSNTFYLAVPIKGRIGDTLYSATGEKGVVVHIEATQMRNANEYGLRMFELRYKLSIKGASPEWYDECLVYTKEEYRELLESKLKELK